MSDFSAAVSDFIRSYTVEPWHAIRISVKSKSANPWVKTTVSNLYRRSDSGRYYARICRNGKSTWNSLKIETKRRKENT